MYVLPPNRLVGPLVVLASLSAFLCLFEYEKTNRTLRLDAWKIGTVGLTLVVSVLVLLQTGDIRVSEFKPISYARQFPDARNVYHDFGPLGEFDAYKSSYFHFAPGLSDNASSNVAAMPADAFLGLYIDGDGPIGIMRRLKPNEESYLNYLPMAAPYLLQKDPRVLLLRLGGGIGAYSGLYHGAKHVTVVEPNPSLLGMLRDTPYFRAYTGDLLRDPRITLQSSEPRAFTASTREKFDLVEISLIDSIGLSQTGGYPITENFIYTVEGIASYLSCLDKGGLLSITVWNRLTPPRNVPKLLSTVVGALRKWGAAYPEDHIFMFDLLLSTGTVLVKTTPFTKGEIDTLLAFCKKMSFTPCYYPGKPDPERAFPEILEGYQRQMRGGSADTDLFPEELYQYTLSWLFQGKGKELYDGYIFNIDSATDDRPYYTAYVKPSMLPLVAKNIKDVSEEWGYILLAATLGVSVIFGALIIMIPAMGRGKVLFSKTKGTFRVLLYFSCLGIGYMLAEIFLIQRLSFFLVDPIFSTSVVITSMLVISGIGSLVGGSINIPRQTLLLIAVGGICGSLLFYITGLSPLLNMLLGRPLGIKILLSILFIFPAAFFLGMPFPTGLSALSENRLDLVPWAWGVNGCFSVTGTVLARLVSISAGYSTVLLTAMALYTLAFFAFSWNEAFYS
jgi:hypothetical protein